MISLAFDYNGSISKQNNNTISGGVGIPDESIKISIIPFNWLKTNVPGFIKGFDSKHGEFGYVLTSIYRQKIKVFTTGNDTQWSSENAFLSFIKELGNKYRPYDPIDYDVFLIPIE